MLAAGSAHVLSVVTYQSVSSHLKVYPDQHMRCVHPSSVALVKTAGVSIDRLLRSAALHAALHARDRPVTKQAWR